MIEPNDFNRSAWRLQEFWLPFVSAMAAGFGMSAWITIPATAAGLLASSLPKYVPLYPRAKAFGATATFWATVGASVLLAMLIGAAAHVLRRVTRWLWGL